MSDGECQQCKELARLLRTEIRVGDEHYAMANTLLEYVLALRELLRKYAVAFHGNSAYHIGGASTFERCEVSTCVKVRELIGTVKIESKDEATGRTG